MRPRLRDNGRRLRQPQPLSITVDDKRRVSGLLHVPSAARVCFVLAHGAGAGMSHPLLQPSQMASPNATSRRYAINSLILKGAASAPIRQKSLTPPSALQSPKRRACFPALLFSQEESRLAAACPLKRKPRHPCLESKA